MTLLAFLAAAALAAFGFWLACLRMPGRSQRGAPPAPGESQFALAAELERDVRALSQLGERSVQRGTLAAAAAVVSEGLASTGLTIGEPEPGNLAVEVPGSERPGEIVLVGAHYDSAPGSPGANDNASGVAALLALARRLAGTEMERTLRFVAFANEEPPWFQTEAMGSLRHARACARREERIVAMLSLETLGCYDERSGSQRYPLPLLGLVYPDRGDFVAFVGNVGSRSLVRRAIATFRAAASFPSEGAALPGWIPGVGWSDHWSFWQEGFPAVMVTDTALFRDPRYHTAGDTPEHVDYGRLARVVDGLDVVVRDLAGAR